MGWGSAGYNQQSSSSSSSQGLMPWAREHFSGLAPMGFRQVQKASKRAAADPGGLEYQSVVDQLMPVGEYGLPTGATAGVRQLGRDLFSNASASRSMNGFNQPNNLEGVLGDAIRSASGTLIPLSTNYSLQRAQAAPMLRQASFGYEMTPMQTLQQLLSGSGASQSEGSGFGFQVAGGAGGSSSDRRLKSDIVQIGTHPLGIGWYEYTIFGRKEQGVMADEVLKVKPEAVGVDDDGYMTVDYNLIGRVKG